ncbi:actin-binding protein WASF2-like isoform X2 [Scylla paramamosain]|uniref:actin-binding protein WASF2-like isoform X2 n=1 Tax=Scylla paramamosain TaxID=85552 RepID=UPI003083770A
MPLLKRVVSPVHVSRVPLVEEWVTDENGRVYAALLPATFQPQDLEAFTNLTLANLITQLSSLSRHAEDLFGEMIAESTAILNRTVSLQGRVDKLSVKVKNLDSNVEEVSLQDIHMRKAFKSSTLFDQQVVSRDTIPAPMLETYQTCEQPPPLHQLNPYRDDGKDGLKFYTDPSYFFNLWREEMTQETERLKHDKKQKPSKPKGDGRNKSKKVPRMASNTRERQKQLAIAHGEYIASQPQYRTPPSQINEGIYDESVGMNATDRRPLRPSSIELRGHCGNSHPTESVYGTNSHAYSPTHETNQAAPPSEHPEYPPPYQDQYSDYPPPPYTPDGAVSQGSTPSRSGPRALAGRPMQPPPDPPSNSNTPTPPGGSHSGTPTRLRGPSQGREFLPPPPPPPADRQQQPPMENMTGGVATMSPGPGRHAQPTFNHEPDLPPPPPTPDKSGEPEPPPPSPPPPPPVAPIQPAGQMVGAPPPPSPPPLVPNGNAPGAPPPPPMPPLIINGSQTVLNKPRKVEKKVLPPIEVNGRSELLKAIREGIQLRPRVDDAKTKPKEDPDSIDVATILQRRFAFEVSDSESSSDSESDSDEWDETSA